MNPLLDTVEPDVFVETENGVMESAYFRPKVEALLAECRNIALLDAVQVVIRNSLPYENTSDFKRTLNCASYTKGKQ